VILVPFPHAAEDHQYKNAAALAAVGGAVCLRQEDADEARLARELVRLMNDSVARAAMAEAARVHGRPGASRDVARDLLDLGGIPERVGVGARAPNGHGTNGTSAREAV
jgi:UDP-N-acetylglucosamine--N-acetylmuramyl-(pentapeptide) pyrophosphoryl-undecaprenol N-acetylglucosamine transferase